MENSGLVSSMVIICDVLSIVLLNLLPHDAVYTSAYGSLLQCGVRPSV